MSVKEEAKPAPKAKYGSKTFAQNTVLMSSLTTISRITGFLRITAIASVIGGGFVADSYLLANVIPNYIYELVLGGILSSIIIPIFVEYLIKKSENEAFRVASIIINLSLIILGIIALSGTFFSYGFVKIQTALSGSENIRLAVFFFRFFAIQVVFYGLAAMATGILHSYRRFGIPTFAPILNNLTVISVIIFLYGPYAKTNPKFALTALAAGTTSGVFLLFAVQLPSLIKIGFKYIPSLNIRHPAIKQGGRLAFPLFLYVLGNIIPMWVEVSLGWRFSTGITSLQLAWPFFQLPFGIFAVSVVTALFPSLSENISKGNLKEFKAQISLGLRAIGLIIWPASIGLIILSKPIISLALQHGRFTPEQASLTSGVLSYFGLGLFFFAGFFFLLRAFYARQDTVTPAIISLIGMVFNIIIDLILIRTMSVKGLALGRSLTYFLSFLMLAIILRRKIGSLEKQTITSNVKFLSASVAMGIVAYISLRMVFPLFGGQGLQNQFLLFSIPAVLSGLTYFSSIMLLKSPEVEMVKRLFRRQDKT